ncbi:Polyketide cyclase / dehydrase and lipid transport [Amycolatopsis pretoriensis]|uniref:Polyketide cyclase / dehydrase and lipid transport n=1 Tax=Amycolatopsis pretoriensis TaxID=218821 RepID=A0A1H5QEE9_9PSEU|nr:SRPBCC family protein [Amycolatopsis pretoriensis]SEF24465.1 Polyketide cyclase / dehydrase and lipid transport [Amycolatopsis pretoriensis]
MTTVSRTFAVDPAPDVVVPYLADFGHAEQWDPGTQRCVREDPGPVRVGSSWHNTSKIAGIGTELTYTLEQLTDDRVVLVGRNDTATSTETIEVVPSGTGSSITYTNELEFKGVAKLAAPLGKVVFEKLGDDTERQLTEVLNGLTR